jgi:BASS family bile acid:Na+ symporter
MSLAEVIHLALKASVILTVFGFGLNATFQSAAYLFRWPGKLLRALLSMLVVMLLASMLLVGLFNLRLPVEIALVALAVSPVPPALPRRIFKAGGEASYTIGLLGTAALLAIVLVPLSLRLVGRIFDVPLGMPPSAIALVVLITVLAPLAAGILVRTIAPAFAIKIAKPVSLVALVVLILSALPILIIAWPAIWSLIGNGSVVAFAVFVVVGLLTGHLLGGPDPDERVVLALSTALRHPGVAIAIAQANFPQQKVAMAAVPLYLLVGTIVTILYVKWSASGRAERDSTPVNNRTLHQ